MIKFKIMKRDKRDLVKNGAEFWDPNNIRRPLLRIYPNQINSKISKHFYLYEFLEGNDQELRKYCSQINGKFYQKYIRLDPLLIILLEKLRTKSGEAINITSGYRSYLYNIRMYNRMSERPKTLSRHCSGQAVDILNPSQKLRKVARKVFEDHGIGEGPTQLHIDVRNKRARWYYSGYTPK